MTATGKPHTIVTSRPSQRSRRYRTISAMLTIFCVAFAVGSVWFAVWDGCRADATGTSGHGEISIPGAIVTLTALVGAVWFRVRSNHV